MRQATISGLSISEALEILSGETVYFVKVSKGGATATYERGQNRRSYTGRVRHRKGEGLESLLIRVVESMLAATKSNVERWHEAEERKDKQLGGRELRRVIERARRMPANPQVAN